MRISEAEKRIRSLAHVFARERKIPMDGSASVSGFEFYNWLQEKHPEVLEFRCIGGVMWQVDRWWTSESQQGWKD